MYFKCQTCGGPLPPIHPKHQKYCCDACRNTARRNQKNEWEKERRTPESNERKNAKRRELRARRKLEEQKQMKKKAGNFPSIAEVATEARKRGISYGKMSIILELERRNQLEEMRKAVQQQEQPKEPVTQS